MRTQTDKLLGRMGKRLIVNKREKEMKLNNKGNIACSIHIFTNTLCDSQLLCKVPAI